MLQKGIVAVVTASSICTSALAADLKLPPLRTPKTQNASPIQSNQPNCARWTDDCVNCSRGADGGAPICSNIGIACQPGAVRCLELLNSSPAK